jgi:hypothetical protein
MPPRNHASAPAFNPAQLRTLRPYFDDLECLFTTCAISLDSEKKSFATRYLDYDSCDLWEVIPQFGPSSTYEDFVQAIYRLYPGSHEDRKYSYADLEKLIEGQMQTEIKELEDLGVYYRKFLQVSNFLLSKHRISQLEQSRMFGQGFETRFWHRILQRIEIKFPDHHPDDPLAVSDVYDIALYLLHGTPTSSTRASDIVSSSSKIASPPSPIHSSHATLPTIASTSSDHIPSSREQLPPNPDVSLTLAPLSSSPPIIVQSSLHRPAPIRSIPIIVIESYASESQLDILEQPLKTFDLAASSQHPVPCIPPPSPSPPVQTSPPSIIAPSFVTRPSSPIADLVVSSRDFPDSIPPPIVISPDSQVRFNTEPVASPSSSPIIVCTSSKSSDFVDRRPMSIFRRTLIAYLPIVVICLSQVVSNLPHSLLSSILSRETFALLEIPSKIFRGTAKTCRRLYHMLRPPELRIPYL